MLIQVVLPKPEISLRPVMVGAAVVTIGTPLEAPPRSAGAIWVVPVSSIGARLMAKAPSPYVLAIMRFGSGVAVGLAAERDCEPLTVALADRVRLFAVVLTDRIVVPAGMPRPVMTSPAARLDVPVLPTTVAEPVVSVPVKTKVWYGPARAGIPVATATLPCDRLRSVTLTCGRSPPGATAPYVDLGVEGPGRGRCRSTCRRPSWPRRRGPGDIPG